MTDRAHRHERRERRGDAHPARRRGRKVLPLLASIGFVAVLVVGVFPTRAIVDQRHELSRAEENLRVIEARNAELAERVEALGTDEEIERLAREHHNLGRPGEEIYAILPPPPAPLVVPDAWPFEGLRAALDSSEG